jgi:hypothetical protein
MANFLYMTDIDLQHAIDLAIRHDQGAQLAAPFKAELERRRTVSQTASPGTLSLQDRDSKNKSQNSS